MDLGRMEKSVTFQKLDGAHDTSGAPVQNWITHCTRWVELEPLTGRELLQAQQIRGQVDYRLRTYYDALTATVTPKMRALYGSRVFQIHAIINRNEANEELEMLCLEAING